jgi:hypothetical protein
MKLTIWCLAQEGMDRVLVQTSEPTQFQKDAAKPSKIFKVEVELPEVVKADRTISIQSDLLEPRAKVAEPDSTWSAESYTPSQALDALCVGATMGFGGKRATELFNVVRAALDM